MITKTLKLISILVALLLSIEVPVSAAAQAISSFQSQSAGTHGYSIKPNSLSDIMSPIRISNTSSSVSIFDGRGSQLSTPIPLDNTDILVRATSRAEPTPNPAVGPTPEPTLNPAVGPTPEPTLNPAVGSTPEPTLRNLHTLRPSPTQTPTPTSSPTPPGSQQQTKSLYPLQLTAAKYPVNDPRRANNYPMDSHVFVDWNMSQKEWSFRWDTETSANDDVKGILKGLRYIWQVSSMPFDGSDIPNLYPPGYLSSGVPNADGHTFVIDFSKFAPSKSKIQQKPVNNVTMQSVNSGIDQSLKQAIAQNGLNIPFFKLNKFKSSLQGNINRINSSMAASVNKPNINQKAINELKTLSAQGKTPTYQQVQESVGMTQTQYKYYVRVLGFDDLGKPVAVSSNQMLVQYGDPLYDESIVLEPKKLVVVDNYTDLGGQESMFLNWSTPKGKLTSPLKAPITDTTGYGYSWFQLTNSPSGNSTGDIFQPDGLIHSFAANTIQHVNSYGACVATTLNFSGMLPSEADIYPKNLKLYLRGINVFPDYDNPGHARLTVSHPMDVTYGKDDSDAVNAAMAIDVNIGIPAARIVSYTPPYDGSIPKDRAVVVKKPWVYGPNNKPLYSAFGLELGQKVRISDLQSIAEDNARNQPWYTQFLDGMAFFFTAIINQINAIPNAWSKIQSYAVEAMAKVGIPPVIGGLILNSALTALGVPPTLPNFGSLTSGSLSAMIVDQSGGWIPKDVADKLSKEVVAQASDIANRPISNLPEGLGILNGCLKPDYDFVWRPATVTMELKNITKARTPSGEFDMKVDYYIDQRVQYPSLAVGQSITLTVTLDESTKYEIKNGEKKIKRKEWIAGVGQLSIGVSDFTPVLPTQENLAKEYGIPSALLLIRYHNLSKLTHVKQWIGGYDKDWKATTVEFPTIYYVSNKGSDLPYMEGLRGSSTFPFKTLNHAINKAKPGDAIILMPGINESTPINVTKQYITITGYGPGVVLRGKNNTTLNIMASKALILTLSDFTLFGSITLGGGMYGTHLNNLVVIKSDGVGISVGEDVNIDSCTVSQTGQKNKQDGDGIRINAQKFTIKNTIVNNVPGNGIIVSTQEAPIYYVKNIFSNVTVSNCGQNGILLDTTRVNIENSFIHDTDFAGIGFKRTNYPLIHNCTILDTAKKSYSPITLYAADKPTLTSQIEIYGHNDAEPKRPLLDHCIVAQVNVKAASLIYVQYTVGLLTLPDYVPAIVQNNVYYIKNGKVGFLDSRPYALKGYYADDDVQGQIANLLPYSQTWKRWTGDEDSLVSDPKLDRYGRTSVQALKAYGVQ